MQDRRPLPFSPIAALAAIAACLSGCMVKHIHKSDQGIYGTFKTYGPPRELADCTPFKTQFEMDECRHLNERVIEEPHQAMIKIRNLQTGATSQVELDAEGSYKVSVTPGEYEVCVGEECSDPMTVRMNDFITYGQRLPRPAASGGAAVKAPPADTLKEATGSVSP